MGKAKFLPVVASNKVTAEILHLQELREILKLTNSPQQTRSLLRAAFAYFPSNTFLDNYLAHIYQQYLIKSKLNKLVFKGVFRNNPIAGLQQPIPDLSLHDDDLMMAHRVRLMKLRPEHYSGMFYKYQLPLQKGWRLL